MNFKTGIAMTLVAGIALFIEGCKKDEVKSSGGACYVTKATTVDDASTSSSTTFGYSSSHVLTTVSFTISGGSGAAVENFNYDASGKVTSITTNFGITQVNTYNGNGQLVQLSTKNADNVETQRTTYIYNASGQVIEMDEFAQQNGTGDVQPFTHETYTYPNTTTGNPDTNAHYVDAIELNTFTGTDHLEYDSKKTPSTSSNDDSSSSNNVTKIVLNNANGDLVNTTTYTYTYSSNDYPLTVDMASTGNSHGLAAHSSKTTYVYNCP